MTVDAVRMRNVEWPMNVTATLPTGTAAGGGGYGERATCGGHAVRSRVRIQVITSEIGRGLACGLKNRSPSQWSETG
jgi:hypothetical protein